MTLLADVGDAFSFGWLLLISVSIPSVGLIVSGATMRKRGLNPWCGAATLMFFGILLVESIVLSLAGRDGLERKTMLWALFGCCAAHVLSALLALVGLAQVRKRRRWTHGRRRSLWTFWINVLVLLAISFWCFAHVNPTLYNQLMH